MSKKKFEELQEKNRQKRVDDYAKKKNRDDYARSKNLHDEGKFELDKLRQIIEELKKVSNGNNRV